MHALYCILGCIEDSDCHEPSKYCDVNHMCVDKLCPSPVGGLLSSRLRFSHDIHKVGTTAQVICSRGSIYHLGKNQHSNDGIPIKKVNLHCTVGSDGVARYIDDFGNAPLTGCSKGIF